MALCLFAILLFIDVNFAITKHGCWYLGVDSDTKFGLPIRRDEHVKENKGQ